MRILGIDPGYGIVGFGVIETNNQTNVIDYGVISTPKELSLPERLEIIYSSLCSLIFSVPRPLPAAPPPQPGFLPPKP